MMGCRAELMNNKVAAAGFASLCPLLCRKYGAGACVGHASEALAMHMHGRPNSMVVVVCVQ